MGSLGNEGLGYFNQWTFDLYTEVCQVTTLKPTILGPFQGLQTIHCRMVWLHHWLVTLQCKGQRSLRNSLGPCYSALKTRTLGTQIWRIPSALKSTNWLITLHHWTCKLVQKRLWGGYVTFRTPKWVAGTWNWPTSSWGFKICFLEGMPPGGSAVFHSNIRYLCGKVSKV